MHINPGLLVFLACVPAAAFAQGEARPNPSEAAAKVPAVEYRSAFADYRASPVEPIAAWPKLHLELGPPLWGPGSEAARPAGASPAPVARPAGAPAPHAGHGAGSTK